MLFLSKLGQIFGPYLSDLITCPHPGLSCYSSGSRDSPGAARAIVCYCRSQWNLTLDRAGDLLSGAELDPGGLFLLRSSGERDLTLGQALS